MYLDSLQSEILIFEWVRILLDVMSGVVFEHMDFRYVLTLNATSVCISVILFFHGGHEQIEGCRLNGCQCKFRKVSKV